ncbi:MAG: hypothetical protein IPH07_32250 [Deltaproteobacteria bacterium]|nr:hypothetical protein [Deltaproteobacteria bacterium]MBK8719825.1 hypothetical protein [Deltaproteobacteria bacterium]MBP7285198.1 hypothetical protein [Nannocystaceae bacterium]
MRPATLGFLVIALSACFVTASDGDDDGGSAGATTAGPSTGVDSSGSSEAATSSDASASSSTGASSTGASSTGASSTGTSSTGSTGTASDDASGGSSSASAASTADGSSGSEGPAPDCAAFDDCEDCGAVDGCGWCGATGSCAAGDASGPAGGSCSGGWVDDGDFFSCPAANCFAQTDCASCQDAYQGCGWCASNSTCMPGAPDMPAPGGSCEDEQWYFDICPEDCAGEMTCVSCTGTVGCGWCTAGNTCMAGTSAGPLAGSCGGTWSIDTDACF